MITVNPSSSLVDQKVQITVTGLKPRQKITLHARIVGDKGEEFESHAYFIADEDNQVDVTRHPSVGGSYTGVEAVGLLWSMKAAPGQRKGIILRKTDVTTPYNVKLNCFEGHLSPSNKPSLEPVSSITFEKWYMADGVKRIPVREGRIRGTLFLPPGEGPFPGVMDLLGGMGGLNEFKASLLASHGFAALALAYINYDDLPSDQQNIDLEYIEEAAEWLIQHPMVLSDGIGLHANCLGAWVGLLLASFRSNLLKALVAISPWHAGLFKGYMYRGKRSSAPRLPSPGTILTTDDGVIYRFCWSTIPHRLEEPHTMSETLPVFTPVDKISCPVLLVYGTDDLHVDTDLTVGHISQQMKKAGKGHLCSVLRLLNAGHFIEPPYCPHKYSSYFKAVGMNVVWGGETRAHALGEELAWKKLLDFLHQNLSGNIKSSL